MLNLLDKKILFYLLETFHLKHFILYPRDLKNPICLIYQDLQAFFTGQRSAVSDVSGNRCESDSISMGPEFNPGPVPYFHGD